MSIYVYIAVMALVSYTIRILPLTLIRKPIKNQFIQASFQISYIIRKFTGQIIQYIILNQNRFFISFQFFS